jgi:hypothetical protein
MKGYVITIINFNEEINKYKPIIGLEDVENTVKQDELKDIMDMLTHITTQITKSKE